MAHPVFSPPLSVDLSFMNLLKKLVIDRNLT